MAAANPVTRLNAALEGRYRVERQLGEGGMATVYLAHDLRHERRVALKVLKPELAAVVGAERFLTEIKTTANLQHPHILPLFDSGEAGGFLFYVMPYVEGESLRERLDREHQLPVDEAVQIARNVAEGLDYAHRHGVIHRDIKPANILLQDGKPVVSDFGIALALGVAGAGRLTETGLSLGTPHYMSPEQATGDVSVGAATDIYALGCVLYEMLVGEPPFTGSTPQAVLGKIIQAKPVSATEARRTVPPHVDGVIRKALEKVPADRFRTATELARALADPGFRVGERATAAGGPTGAGPWKVSTGALAVALVLAVAWPLLRPAPRGAVARYSIALAPGQAFAEARAMNGLAVSPGGEWFVYSGAGEGGQTQLWLRRRDQLLATPLPGTEGGGNPSVSPDGTKIAFTTGPGNRAMRLMVSAVAGGPPLLVADSLVDPGGVSWGYDGYIYYDGNLEGDGLARVPEGGGVPEPVTMPDTAGGEVWHAAPAALPNGSGVLFQDRRDDQTFDVAVVDLRTGRHEVLVRGGQNPVYSRTGHIVYVSPDGTLLAVPFDEDALALTGDPVAIVDGVQVRGNSRADIALSNGGTMMYRAGETAAGARMVWVTRDGGVSEVDPALPAGDYSNPAVSPDGRQLAITVSQGSDAQIWVKQLPDGRFSRFTTEGINDLATWARDGRELAFVSFRGDDVGLYRQPADGSVPPRLVLDPRPRIRLTSFSRDGTWLVYDDAAVDVSGVRLDPQGSPTGEPVALRSRAAAEARPALSPDGRWLAYQSNESGMVVLYVCPFPTCDVTYPVSIEEGAAPIWAPDGSELYYVNPRILVLMSVEVRSGTPASWGSPRPLFSVAGFVASVRPFDIAPDGQRFLMLRAEGAVAESELILVQNFSELLRELAPS